ncbi:MAG: hypothetical protein AAGB00_08865 [Planctomycetota bacterium]
MPGAYSSFDTLSLEWGITGPDAGAIEELPPELPVLARIPDAGRPASIPCSGAPSETPPAGDARPLDPPHAASPPPHTAAGNFAASVFEVRADQPRVMPVEDGPIDRSPTTPQPQPAPGIPNKPAGDAPRRPAKDAAAIKPSEGKNQKEEGGACHEGEEDALAWSGRLARLEASIAEYTPIIVLVTLLTAAGLIVALLRGEAASVDGGSPIPGADLTGPAVLTSTADARSGGSPPQAGNGASPLGGLAPLAPPAGTTVVHAVDPSDNRVPSTARGPVSAALRAPRLADAGIVEPYREPGVAGAAARGGLDGPTPPVARLSQTILPPTEQRK